MILLMLNQRWMFKKQKPRENLYQEKVGRLISESEFIF